MFTQQLSGSKNIILLFTLETRQRNRMNDLLASFYSRVFTIHIHRIYLGVWRWMWMKVGGNFEGIPAFIRFLFFYDFHLAVTL